jgi:hypothetical protein
MWVGGKGERDGYFGRTRSGGVRGRGRVNDKGGREGFHHHLRPSLCAKLQREGQSCGRRSASPHDPPCLIPAPLQRRPAAAASSCGRVQLRPRPAAAASSCISGPLPLRPQSRSGYPEAALPKRPCSSGPPVAVAAPPFALFPVLLVFKNTSFCFRRSGTTSSSELSAHPSPPAAAMKQRPCSSGPPTAALP